MPLHGGAAVEGATQDQADVEEGMEQDRHVVASAERETEENPTSSCRGCSCEG